MSLRISKAFIPLALLVLITMSACKKSDSYMNHAVITGYDNRFCACCGGLLINFNNDTVSYHGTFYDCDNAPSSLGIDSTTTFPIRLKVNWKTNPLVCDSNSHILISSYAKQ